MHQALLIFYLFVALALRSLPLCLSQEDVADVRRRNETKQDIIEEGRDVLVKIGFIIGSQRGGSRRSHIYSSVDWQMMELFKYGIDKLNQANSRGPNEELFKPRGGSNISLRFVPMIGETNHDEETSIKQTIDLMVKQEVDFIIGPQETCQIESALASLYNVAMISHYCPQPINSPPEVAALESRQASRSMAVRSVPVGESSSFIQIRPPYWMIVMRVASLVERLLRLDDYPNRLVLLYFKATTAPSSVVGDPLNAKESTYTKASGQLNSSEQQGQQRQEANVHLLSAINEALQYKLIGEFLEIKLNELLESNKLKRRAAQQKQSFDVQSSQTSRTGDNNKEACSSPDESRLSVLNWHSSYHNGFTKNPFRRLIRRYLSGLKAPKDRANESPERICPRNPQGFLFTNNETSFVATNEWRTSNKRARRRRRNEAPSAIFIVVGHYYEHLGLLQALNELNIIELGNRKIVKPSTDAVNERQRSVQGAAKGADPRWGKASIPNIESNSTWTSSKDTSRRSSLPSSLVIGVDIEPYDEQEDSMRFLRGLLMENEATYEMERRRRLQHVASSALNETSGGDDATGGSVHEIFGRYLGIVPARPTNVAELIDEIRRWSKRTNSAGSSSEPQNVDAKIRSSKYWNEIGNMSSNIAQTISLDPSLMLRLVRLRAESLHLLDALELVGSYAHECLSLNRTRVSECRRADRTLAWFRGRRFRAQSNGRLVRLNERAASEGSYALIKLNFAPQAPSAAPNQESDLEFGLVTIGHFGGHSEESRVELSGAYNESDLFWRPLWCELRGSHEPPCTKSNDEPSRGSHEANVRAKHNDDREPYEGQDYADDDEEDDEDANEEANEDADEDHRTSTISLAGLTFGLVLLLSGALVLLAGRGRHFRAMLDPSMLASRASNEGWFDSEDERNFLLIVRSLLVGQEQWADLAATRLDETSNAADHRGEEGGGFKQDDDGTPGDHRQPWAASSFVPLHCHMFLFPSCKFVHWLVALHTLKDMMFKHQSRVNPNLEQVDQRTRRKKIPHLHSKEFSSLKNAPELANNSFFASKHSGSGTVRILMHKYKALNERLCSLSQLSHESVAKLRGVTLICANLRGLINQPMNFPRDRQAQLIVEQSERGNLRQALKQLDEILDTNRDSDSFKLILVVSMIEDALSGLDYLHNVSKIKFHGELRATTCLVSHDWRLKLSGFHAHHMRRSLGQYEQMNPAFVSIGTTPNEATKDCLTNMSMRRMSPNEPLSASPGGGGSTIQGWPGEVNSDIKFSLVAGNNFDELLYYAPELLQNIRRLGSFSERSLQLADTYSFAFLVYEMLAGEEPWKSVGPKRQSRDRSRLLLERVKVDPAFRPPLERLDKSPSLLLGCPTDGRAGDERGRSASRRHEKPRCCIRTGRLIEEQEEDEEEKEEEEEKEDQVESQHYASGSSRAELSSEMKSTSISLGVASGVPNSAAESATATETEAAAISTTTTTTTKTPTIKNASSAIPAHSRDDQAGPGSSESLKAAKSFIRSCWAHMPDRRPQSVSAMKGRLESLISGLRFANPPASIIMARISHRKVNNKVISDVNNHKSSSSSSSSSGDDHPEGAAGVSNAGSELLVQYSQLLESEVVTSKRNLGLECDKNFRLAHSNLPRRLVAQMHSPVGSGNRCPDMRTSHVDCLTLCVFRISLISLDAPNEQRNPIEVLDQLVAQLDSLVSLYHGRIHVVDSQTDSSLRFLAYSTDDLLEARAKSASPMRNVNPGKWLGTGGFDQRQLMASFALQLIDRLNQWQVNFRCCLQLRCGLHCGFAWAGLVPGQPGSFGHQARGGGGDDDPFDRLRLARYFFYGPALNVTDCLEVHSLPQRIQISSEFREKLLQAGERPASLASGSAASLAGGKAPQVAGGGAAWFPTSSQPHHQGYTIIKRECKLKAKLLGFHGFAADLDAYWLLNGPRVSATQSIMLRG